MKYTSTYVVPKKSYQIEYDQVVYNHNGKTKHKSIDKTTISFTPPEQITFSTTSSGALDISKLPTELVSSHIDSLFTLETIKKFLFGINNVITAGQKILIDIQTLLNPTGSGTTWFGGGVWPLGTSVPAASALPG
jgi:hypothetical protein